MSGTIKSEFADTNGQGGITLYKNHFEAAPGKNKKEFFARFNRRTVTVDNLIARIQKKEAGTKGIVLEQVAAFFKEEIAQALRNGEAVNMFDFGVMYPAVLSLKTDGDGANCASSMQLCVRFTPSAYANDAVSNVEISNVHKADNTPLIEAVTDLSNGEEQQVTAGQPVRLTGTRLCLGGEDSFVAFAPADGDDMEHDESKWLYVKNHYYPHNTMRQLEFFAPEDLVRGNRYFIVLNTAASSGKVVRKNYVLGFSQSPVIAA